MRLKLLIVKFSGKDDEMTPNGNELLKTLIELLADQEGVKITFELSEQ